MATTSRTLKVSTSGQAAITSAPTIAAMDARRRVPVRRRANTIAAAVQAS
ncbi:hypothetical protein [Streptomyces sp. SID13031]|nr:hypothetical protein [Streptomyces sp. SID13031]NEA30298.1 hypothetical protein [Streptomyces sp. SID13031]